MKIIASLATLSMAVALQKTEDATRLTNHGADAHIDAVGGLGLCQGDCDNSAHCRTGLICYHSNKGGRSVRGCEGKTHGKTDYCVLPKTGDASRLTNHGNNAHSGAVGGLGMCQGDCDIDAHCRDDLVCHHGDVGGRVVKGCEGKTHGEIDYCIVGTEAVDFSSQDSSRLGIHGADAHLDAVKSVLNGRWVGGLGLCQGDCDTDKQCRSGLICHHGDVGGKIVPACLGKTVRDYDYCIPDECDATHCPQWTCAQWCKCYVETSVSLYAASGCVDDGTGCDCESNQ